MTDEILLQKYPGMRDVAMQILEIDRSVPGKVKLKVDWWNIGECHPPYPMAVFQEFEVSSEWVEDLEIYNFKRI